MPVWVGGCPWRQLVPKYNADPKAYPQVEQALEAAVKAATAGIELPDESDVPVGSELEARPPAPPIATLSTVSLPHSTPLALSHTARHTARLLLGALPAVGVDHPECDTTAKLWIHGKESNTLTPWPGAGF